MDGMCHADDVRIAESLRDVELPADSAPAMALWNRTLNDAVVRWHRDAGHDVPDLNALDAQGINLTFFHAFPHYFVLPMYSSASAYRFRPLGPEETLMEIWSLARFPEGPTRRGPDRPRCGSATIRGGRRFPRRTSRTSRGSRRVCTPRGSSTCACPVDSRDTSRTSSGRSTASSPGCPTSNCSPRSQAVNVYPFEQPMRDLGF